MSPEENFNFVNAYNRRMGPVIQNNNGFVNQYLGDGIMALFTDTPTDALQAAVQMQKTIQSYNGKRIRKGQTPIRVGMGMHLGPLIMGITGDENRLDATTISDTVNSAARIEDLSKHYGTSILLSGDCLQKIENQDEFNFRYLGGVQVKGKKEALKIYECFDGDLPEMVALKSATQTEFEKGINYYFEQSFSQAALVFGSVLNKTRWIGQRSCFWIRRGDWLPLG